jgi:Ca2+-binding RTX toxin-like protein
MTKAELEATDFQLGDGNDTLIVDADVEANITAHGGNGDDTMIGGKGNDRFDGGAGDDRLIGGAGRDTLVGGSGNNTVIRDFADWVLPLPTVRIPEMARP